MISAGVWVSGAVYIVSDQTKCRPLTTPEENYETIYDPHS